MFAFFRHFFFVWPKNNNPTFPGQSPTQTQPPRENRVHFPDDQVQQHDSKIVLERGLSDDELNVHLGFLQISHCYEVKFEIEDTLGEAVTWDSSKATCAVMLVAKPSTGGKLKGFLLRSKSSLLLHKCYWIFVQVMLIAYRMNEVVIYCLLTDS